MRYGYEEPSIWFRMDISNGMGYGYIPYEYPIYGYPISYIPLKDAPSWTPIWGYPIERIPSKTPIWTPHMGIPCVRMGPHWDADGIWASPYIPREDPISHIPRHIPYEYEGSKGPSGMGGMGWDAPGGRSEAPLSAIGAYGPRRPLERFARIWGWGISHMKAMGRGSRPRAYAAYGPKAGE